MMRTLAILLLATITIGAAQRIVSCENDHWRLGDRSRKVESCNECAGRNSQGNGCEGECKWNDDRKTCVHKAFDEHNMVDCGNGIQAPTCRQCRSDIGDYECGGECTWHPERPNVCTWKSQDYRADRLDNHRRLTFQKELVGAVNKLRDQYQKSALTRVGTNDINNDWLTRFANDQAEKKARDCNTEIKVVAVDSRRGTTAMEMHTCDQFLAGTDPVFGMTIGQQKSLTNPRAGRDPFRRLHNVRDAWLDTMLGNFRFMGVAIGKNDKCRYICRRGETFTTVVAYLE